MPSIEWPSVTVQVPWSAAEYNEHLPPRPTGFDGPIEDKMEQMFPPPFSIPFPVVNEPCSLSDGARAILYWYLPNALTERRQVCNIG